MYNKIKENSTKLLLSFVAIALLLGHVVNARPLVSAAESDGYSLYFSLASWLEEQGYEAGETLGWGDVRNAGSTLIAQDNGAVLITNRDAQWNGMEVLMESFPGDRLIIEGNVPTPVADGMQVWIQFPHTWDTFGINVAADGTFSYELVVPEATATGSDNFRVTSNEAGASSDITVSVLAVYRHDDAEAGDVPDYDFIDHDFPVLDSSYLGNNVLRVDVPAGNQWDGLRLSRAAIAPYLTADGVYEFSVDLFTPQSPEGVGLMLQTNGPRWAHLLITPNFAPDASGQWTRFNSALDFEGRPNILNPVNILSYDWTEIQLVKRGTGSGGINDGSMVIFFIDNFTITNAAGEVVWRADFEDGTNPFTASPAAINMQVIPANEAGDVDIIVPEFDLDLPSLADRFANYFLFGNIWSNPSIMGEPNTEAFFLNQFNAVTAENHHKPDHIAPSPDPATWNFATADAIVDWAEANDLAMIGHTLVWHSQSPLWMTGREGHATLPLVTRAQAMQNMEDFISIYAGRYAGRMFSWDVLNEVFTDSVGTTAWEANPNWRAHLRREGVGLNNPNYLRWYDAFANGATGDECGSDFIFYAFYFARQADPTALLYYNDFNEEQPGKSMAIAQMVVEINERWENHPSYDGRLLIEVIGMQSHHHLDQWATNFDNIRPAMIRFIETGARISVTELDITIGTQANPLPMPLPAADQQRLADAYARVMGYYLEFAEYMNRVSIWGLADSQSWRAWGQPLLFDGSLQAKDAFWAVYNATPNVGTQPTPTEPPTEAPTEAPTQCPEEPVCPTVPCPDVECPTDPDCPTGPSTVAPSTPPRLPDTGAIAGSVALVGLAAVATGIAVKALKKEDN
ncbi:MAG: endo-1,4-beta-xylanase [Turicibacter sp.]|nr:endo-1,4-beta-xylanase [Turicibacter sp.]